MITNGFGSPISFCVGQSLSEGFGLRTHSALPRPRPSQGDFCIGERGMTSATPNGFMETFANGVFSLEHMGNGVFKLWVGTYDNREPHILHMDANQLAVFANNLLDAAEKAESNHVD